MDHRHEVQQFLTAARGRLTPRSAGVAPSVGERRVPGLRRQEVAELAGVSTVYYTRIERGDLRGVSRGVLDALAGALRLDDAEHAYLLSLARTADGTAASLPDAVEDAPERVRLLVETMDGLPVIATNHRRDPVAANALGRALFPHLFPDGSAPLNLAEYTFLDDRSRSFYPDWETLAQGSAANLRLIAGRYPEDRRLHALISRLRERSPEFRTWWEGQTVRVHTHGTKTINHPRAGLLHLTFDVLEVPSAPGVTVNSYRTEPGSADADALEALRSSVG